MKYEEKGCLTSSEKRGKALFYFIFETLVQRCTSFAEAAIREQKHERRGYFRKTAIAYLCSKSG